VIDERVATRKKGRRYGTDVGSAAIGCVLGPTSQEIQYGVGPLRVVGWLGDKRKPLLHAKLLVVGRAVWEERHLGEHGEYTEESLRFEPQSVWCGSANWTIAAPRHLEMGMWSDDPQLCEHATDFLDDLICFSEPHGSTSDDPDSDLSFPRGTDTSGVGSAFLV